MIKINRLFWRIFFAFWLANILALLATAIMIISAMDTAHFKQKHYDKMYRIAEEIIEYYEHSGFSTKPKQPTTIAQQDAKEKTTNQRYPREHRHFLGRIHKYHPFRIYEDNDLIYKHREEKFRSKEIFEIIVERPSGKVYRIQTTKGAPPRFLIDALKKLNAVQFIAICLASTIVSFLLSWNISKPLKQLGRYSREYAKTGQAPQINPRLLRRGDEVGELANDLQFMVQTIESSLVTQQQLLHDVSHELRAPLARLQAATAIIEQQNQDDKYTGRIHLECERMAALIQQILDYSRLEQSDTGLERTNIENLLHKLLVDLEFESHSRTITISSVSDPNIQCYPELLCRALENILRNTYKYTPQNSAIDISLLEENQQFVIKIRDYGEGVQENELEQLLKPFYRSGNQMHTDGFGLGLSIAQRAMLKHNGKITLNNHPNGGLEVSLLFNQPYR